MDGRKRLEWIPPLFYQLSHSWGRNNWNLSKYSRNSLILVTLDFKVSNTICRNHRTFFTQRVILRVYVHIGICTWPPFVTIVTFSLFKNGCSIITYTSCTSSDIRRTLTLRVTRSTVKDIATVPMVKNWAPPYPVKVP